MAAITTPEASVIVGAFVLAGTLVQAVLGVRSTRKAIGKPNGKGNVVEMLESLLTRQSNILTSMDNLMTRHDKLVVEVDVVRDKMAEHHLRLLEHIADTKTVKAHKAPTPRRKSAS